MTGLKKWTAAGLLAIVHIAALFASFLSPYDPVAQHRDFSYAPPTAVRWVDANGHWHLRPFVSSGAAPAGRGMYPIRFFVQGYPYHLFRVLPCTRHLFAVDGDGVIFLLGTDMYGRDQLSRLVQGSRVSLLAAWIATLLSLAIGGATGALAGFYGGWTDDLIMRAGEVCMSVPWLYLLLAARAFMPLHIPPGGAYLVIAALVGVLGWARPARLVRGVVLAAREQGYVLAARGFGASTPYLLRVHIVPDAMSVLVTQAALLVPQYIMAEVTLSFLGLGIDEPVPSWGTLIAAIQHYYVLSAYWWMLVPAIAPIVVALCCFSIGDALLAERRATPL